MASMNDVPAYMWPYILASLRTGGTMPTPRVEGNDGSPLMSQNSTPANPLKPGGVPFNSPQNPAWGNPRPPSGGFNGQAGGMTQGLADRQAGMSSLPQPGPMTGMQDRGGPGMMQGQPPSPANVPMPRPRPQNMGGAPAQNIPMPQPRPQGLLGTDNTTPDWLKKFIQGGWGAGGPTGAASPKE